MTTQCATLLADEVDESVVRTILDSFVPGACADFNHKELPKQSSLSIWRILQMKFVQCMIDESRVIV
jgi:hypothetical protein